MQKCSLSKAYYAQGDEQKQLSYLLTHKITQKSNDHSCHFHKNNNENRNAKIKINVKNNNQSNHLQDNYLSNSNVISPAPFNTSQIRQIWRINNNPSPASYLNHQNIMSTSIIKHHQQQDFYIYDQPKNSSMFKSASKRFKPSINQANPGPGDYQTHPNQNMIKSYSHFYRKPTKLMKYLYQVHKEINNPFDKNFQLQLKSSEKKERPKTGNQKSKQHKSSMFSSETKRNIFERPQTSAGPGSYNLNNVNQKNSKMNLRKSTGKTQCTRNPMDKLSQVKYQQQKDKKITAINNYQREHTSIDYKIKLQNVKQFQDKSKKQFQGSIGPGTYFSDNNYSTLIKKSLSKGVSCFGSKAERFKGKTQGKEVYLTPGPGFYSKKSSCINQEMLKKSISTNFQSYKSELKNIPFGSEKQKQFCLENRKNQNKQLSPCTYQSYNDFYSLMKNNFLKGCIGSFGSTQQRFKNNQSPQKSINKNKEQKQNKLEINIGQKESKNKKLGNRIFKGFVYQGINDNSKKKNLKKSDRRPLWYDQKSNTLQNKYNKKQQKDIPFGVGVDRFGLYEQKQNYEKMVLNEIQENRKKCKSNDKNRGNLKDLISSNFVIMKNKKNKVQNKCNRNKQNDNNKSNDKRMKIQGNNIQK